MVNQREHQYAGIVRKEKNWKRLNGSKHWDLEAKRNAPSRPLNASTSGEGSLRASGTSRFATVSGTPRLPWSEDFGKASGQVYFLERFAV
jgi:hypothetical protein